MDANNNALSSADSSARRKWLMKRLYSVSTLVLICVVWYFAAKVVNSALILPEFPKTIKELFFCVTNRRILTNLWITLKRVLTGSGYGILAGGVLGFLMGYSKNVMRSLAPVVDSLRQVPIMAWVPLSIVWFGLGEGPTVFLIFMSAVFPLTLNTIAGVAGIDPNYVNAARSMGAGTVAIYRDIIIPGALPGFIKGCRLAVGSGWMSVICAEFIATSSGFGFLMIEAQERLQTARLYALMILSAVVGYLIDLAIRFIERRLTFWRYRNGSTED